MRILSKTKIWLTLAVIAALALSSGAALAHGGREVGDYEIVVGFMNEPAYEGMLNGLDLRVTKTGTAADGMAMGDMTSSSSGVAVDVNAHGTVFMSETLSQGGTFAFEAPHELEDQTIPYHNHLDHEMTGSIAISDSAPLSGTAEIKIHDGMFDPAEISVQPHTTVKWTNEGTDPVLLTSGLPPEEGHTDEAATTDVPVLGLEDTLKAEVTHVPTNSTSALTLQTVFNDPGHYAANFIPTAPGVYQFRIFGNIDGTPVDETFVSQGGGGEFADVVSTDTIQFPEKLPQVREIESAVKGTQTTAQEAQDSAASASTLAIIGIVLGVVGIVSGVGGVAVGIRKR